MIFHAALVLGACLAAGSALAQDNALDAGEPARPDIRWRWEASPGQRMGPPRFEPGRVAPGGSTPIDYRLWIGHRRTELGIGLLPAVPHADGGNPLDPAPHAAVVLGLRYQVSPQSRLTLDTEISRAAASSSGGRSRHFPFALELASSSPLQGLARGTLLRTHLSADSSLTLRLRGGKLGLYLGVRLTGNE